MPKTVEGSLDARGLRCAIVAGRTNEFVVERLIRGALDCLLRHGADEKNVTVYRVPGSFELPQAARRLAVSKKFDGIICLGVLIRGETSHFEFLASSVARGISRVAEDTGVPATFGVLTTDTMEQAIDRAGGKSGNKGWDAASAAIEMARLKI